MPLREVDWRAVLATDPRVQVDPQCPVPPLDRPLGPCVYVTVDPPMSVNGIGGEILVDEFAGYALIDDVLYGDLDGDGREEAVIRTESTGTGGSFGFLLYREGDPVPRLIAIVPGYKQSVRIEDGLLKVTNPFYFGFEGNCCPTGLVESWWTLVGDELVLVSRSFATTGEGSRPVTLPELVVHGFYRAISQHRLEDAYRFLSPRYQAENPYPAWSAGFSNTVSISVETSPGATEDEVQVRLTAEDEVTGGGRLAQRFTGTWFLIYDAAVPGQYLLDRAVIRRVTIP